MTIIKPTYPVGVSVLLTSFDKVLMGFRKGGDADGKLSTPGGRIEPKEKIVDCAVREFFEETNATIYPKDVEILGCREHFRFNSHYFMFYVHVNRYWGNIMNVEPDKCDGWDFIPMHSLFNPFNPDYLLCTEPTDILAEVLRRCQNKA